MVCVQGGLEGSVLSYHCSPGQYPHPVSHRLCGPDGAWSPLRSASGRRVSHATCRGDVLPRVMGAQTPPPRHYLVSFQTFCVQLNSSWITVIFGPGTSGFGSAPRRASPARKGSVCLGHPRGTAPSLGAGRVSPPSVTTMVSVDRLQQAQSCSKWTNVLQ